MERLDRVPISDVNEINLTPRGWTPLFDAIGKATAHLEAKIKTDGTPPDRTITMIITDGEENHSVEWTKDRVKQRIAELETKNMTFLFLGADIDAFSEAAKVGIGKTMSAMFSNAIPSSIGNAYGITSAKMMRSRSLSASGGSMGAVNAAMSYTSAEQSAIQSGEDATELIGTIKSTTYGGGGSTTTGHFHDPADTTPADVTDQE